MHRVAVLAIAVAVTAGPPGPVLASRAPGPVLASRAAGRAPRHWMTISFAAGPGSSAHWVRRRRAIRLRVGAQLRGPTEFAEVVVHHFRHVAPASGPAFAATGPGAPVLLIGFSSGAYLTRTAGHGRTAWTAYGPAGTVLVSAGSYRSALAAEQGAGSGLTVNMVTVSDSQVTLGPPLTDTITALRYDGAPLVPHRRHCR
jgi:hypothetical protein